MFESNFPVDKASYSYPSSGTPASAWRGARAAEKQALFSGTAKRVYRLDAISLG